MLRGIGDLDDSCAEILTNLDDTDTRPYASYGMGDSKVTLAATSNYLEVQSLRFHVRSGLWGFHRESH